MKNKIALYKKIIRDNLFFDDLFLHDSHKETFAYDIGEEIANVNGELAKRPCRSKAIVLDGLLKAASGDYAGAIIEYSKAIRMYPGLVAAWFYRAGAHSRLDHIEEMDHDYIKAIFLDPGNLKTIFNRAVCNAHFWLFHLALTDFDEVIKRDHTVAQFYLYRGWTKSMLDDHQGALADYNRASELDPSMRIFHSGRGFARLVTGDFKGAIEDLDIDVINNPQKDEACLNRGVAKLAMGDYRGAIDDFDRALLTNDWIHNASTLKGFAFFQLDDFQGALSTFQTLLKVGPQNHIAWFGKGMAKLALGDKCGYADLVKAGEFGFEKAFKIIQIV